MLSQLQIQSLDYSALKILKDPKNKVHDKFFSQSELYESVRNDKIFHESRLPHSCNPIMILLGSFGSSFYIYIVVIMMIKYFRNFLFYNSFVMHFTIKNITE